MNLQGSIPLPEQAPVSLDAGAGHDADANVTKAANTYLRHRSAPRPYTSTVMDVAQTEDLQTDHRRCLV